MQRAYYAIIPANVRYDKRLPANSKLLYGEITALCNEKGFCWAGDKYFADLYGVSKTTVQNWLKALFENNYISKEIEYKEGSKEILHRYIRILEYPTQENLHTPTQENLRDNNTLINNTKNNMSSSEKIPYKEIISYLNQVTNKKYKVTQKWKDLIKARWNEGQRLDDFKKVINVKSSQWLNDSNMNKYLRPQTLFGNKFDDYLQEFREPIKPKQTKNDFEGLEDLFGDPA
ncbi:alpha/beta hydrolase [Enterococcus avium]|jgi:uncharacterized phage protein (TIGR02220 family)|uniref:Alpha/beta hydrolase n=1 Tax=Enterococcus avium TaxID=33945 RepID=A0A8B5W1F0_ENTAV|nr:conserved phage C-terminal domain-containing protein [Enterococcus avium]TRZ33264.1 alpha/beta hydrolase [Enterococcus avium]